MMTFWPQDDGTECVTGHFDNLSAALDHETWTLTAYGRDIIYSDVAPFNDHYILKQVRRRA